MTIGLPNYLAVAAILFTIGVVGIFLNRKNIIIILMSIRPILLATVNLNFVAFSAYPGRSGKGKVFALFVLTVAAAGSRHQPCHPGGLFPQPRHHRG